jgi:hypothetical protein
MAGLRLRHVSGSVSGAGPHHCIFSWLPLPSPHCREAPSPCAGRHLPRDAPGKRRAGCLLQRRRPPLLLRTGGRGRGPIRPSHPWLLSDGQPCPSGRAGVRHPAREDRPEPFVSLHAPDPPAATQGRPRYKTILVDIDAYLLGLVRYVHLNPHFSPAFCSGRARPRIYCVALGSGARRTATASAPESGARLGYPHPRSASRQTLVRNAG